MHTDLNTTLGEIVTADHRTAAVFDRFGMDFCCGGMRTLQEACEEQAVDVRSLLSALDALRESAGADEPGFAQMPLDQLIDHIVSRHHAYVRSAIPVLLAHSTKIVAVHGEKSPELRTVAAHVAEVAAEMTQHMYKEEEILFPYIRALVQTERAGRRAEPSPFGTIHNPIRMMEAEHQAAGNAMRLIREATAGYKLPDFACATYQACFSELEAFERDLHRHVHLENNILFPAAIELEERLA
ncbi:MAG: iron-sulfur cluster repair di-iron protein [Acidobacteria bacterium]|nr:iron-sulfur cluster repair di-iron protein [Acidobacteriota bacterium]